MRGRGAHPLRVVEEGVAEGVPGESGEVGRGQSIQGPVGHSEGEGFVVVLRAGEPLEALEPGLTRWNRSANKAVLAHQTGVALQPC